MSSKSILNLIELIDLNDKYKKPSEFEHKIVQYGTAGFRTKASDLDWVMYRMGLLASLRSLSLDSKFIGCMITASHNPREDNGCKLIDPNGDMLEEKWETYASDLVNSNDLKATLIDLCSVKLKMNQDERQRAKVAVAHDTRSSCQALLDAFKHGVDKLNGDLTNYGILSTPQLHYMVRCLNSNGSYGEPNETGYYDKLSKAFFNVWSMIDFNRNTRYDCDLYVDGANGVGSDKIKQLSQLLASYGHRNEALAHRIPEKTLNINLFNDQTNTDDYLNHLCGADHVKVLQKVPNNLPISSDSNTSKNKIRKYCSFDGDADRLVYFYLSKQENESQKFNLLDGDKISTLIATHLKELIEDAELSDKITLCIVQTAYANGSSTDYIINTMNVKASCVPTGVKHLHHEAQKFDIGVYFEANGHGTILFSENAEKLIEEKYTKLIKNSEYLYESIELIKWIKETKSMNALYNLKQFKDCINQTVGDAISDLLVVELILAMRNLSVEDWNLLYTDLPSRQLKVKIQDRNQVTTTDAERRVSNPIELQKEIDRLVAEMNCKQARAFVRPSGTEDVVRVYAEADTQHNADILAQKISQSVFDLAGGVGTRP